MRSLPPLMPRSEVPNRVSASRCAPASPDALGRRLSAVVFFLPVSREPTGIRTVELGATKSNQVVDVIVKSTVRKAQPVQSTHADRDEFDSVKSRVEVWPFVMWHA
jgi:hypothetical protein